MFTQISWVNYFMMIGSLTLIYYAFIGYRYYRNDWQKILRARISLAPKNTRNINEVFESFVRDMRLELTRQAEGEPNEAAVLSYVRLLIKKYPEIKDPVLHSRVKDFMMREYASSIHLDEEVLGELWN